MAQVAMNTSPRDAEIHHTVGSIYERMHRYENYRGEQRKLLQIFGMQAKEYAVYLMGKSKKFKPYAAKW
jgi:hypothetical protein